MNWANPMQKFQDWFTQQWAIFWGRKIEPKDFPWLVGPFGNLNGIGEDFIYKLAEKESLIVQKNIVSHGLIRSIDELNLSAIERAKLSKKVIDFYEHTSNYELILNVKWNPFFKVFGILINKLFSNRINQLNISTHHDLKAIKSEIIALADAHSGEIKYTVWLRIANNQVMYSGIYGTCQLPSGESCIKAVFPLPQGNATVIMTPSVGKNGELILKSSGKKLGDAGFYFLLKDSKENHWMQFISSFRDRLIVSENDDHISAEQILTLWNLKVVQLNYQIELKE